MFELLPIVMDQAVILQLN